MNDDRNDDSNGGALQRAVAALVSQKAEHGPLVQQIAADEGMSTTTRAALLEHVLHEEIETVAKISALVGSASANAAPPSGRGSGLTVGSLRREVNVGPAARGTVGSLRRE